MNKNSKNYKSNNKIKSGVRNLTPNFIYLFQFLPAISLWHGIMSLPLVVYLFYFFQNPGILAYDVLFYVRFFGTYIALSGLVFYVYCFFYQIKHSNQLIKEGPYNLVRHPQYLAIIIMTFGLTIVALQTHPLYCFNPYSINGYTLIFLIWIAEVLAYIFLAKIEERYLYLHYKEDYINYINQVPFLFPFLKLKLNLVKSES
jgi:protein-S-isoprenylcysteine O-methyltransferase Ste14